MLCPDHFDAQWAPTVAVTIAAEATATLRVGVLVYDVDYRHPVVLAKEAATLDLASEGRLELGLGAGWRHEDYHLAGLRFDPPGRRVDRLAEAIAICRGLWSGAPVDWDGEHYQVHAPPGEPCPHRPGGPVLVVGGGSRRVLSLAAATADIVGLNASLHEGTVGPQAARSALGERFAERRAWVEAGAGPDRMAEIELQLNTFAVAVSNDAVAMVAAVAAGFGLTPEETRTVPMVLAGTVEDICDQLHHHREVYGTSYIVIHDRELDDFAPVVARLAGT